MRKVDFNRKFPGDEKIMDGLKGWSEKLVKHSLYLQEKAGLAMVNRKHPNEFSEEEIAGCAAKITHPYDQIWRPTLEPRVSITMDDKGYTITRIPTPGSINHFFLWVTFVQLDEIEKRLPEHGYVKVDGKWQRAYDHNHQTTKPPNHQTTKPPNHQTTKPPNHQTSNDHRPHRLRATPSA